MSASPNVELVHALADGPSSSACSSRASRPTALLEPPLTVALAIFVVCAYRFGRKEF
jgi:hypothetical protein